MKLNPKSWRIRTTLLIAPIAILFFGYFSIYIYKDDWISQARLSSDTQLIERVEINTFVEKRFLKPDRTRRNLDIIVKDKPYFIRLTDESKTWEKIISYSYGDTVSILYNDRLFQDNSIRNPYELAINSDQIIRLSDTEERLFYGLIFMSTLTLTSGLIFILAYKTYREDLLSEDKLLFKTNKWGLFEKWVLE